MAEVQVGLGERSYPIYIEQNCLERIGQDLAKRPVGNRYGVIADSNVAELYGEKLLSLLDGAGLTAKLFSFPAGEEHKTLQTLGDLASSLVEAGYDRHDALIALGGGVTGDITGFLASIYMRGIPFVQIPTTLLAQVDSSVGGKTGVDLPEGKNLVGTYYQPTAVYIDIEVLQTLPEEEYRGGIAEVIKYGVIYSEEFFSYLEEHKSGVLNLEPQILSQIIATSCEIKAEVVARDEREGGLRRILNFGHTIGHAVEAASNFSIIHGEAVAMGMVAASRLSVLKTLLLPAEEQRIFNLLSSYGLPVMIPASLKRVQIKDYLKSDKKAVAGKVVYVLPTGIGSTTITDEVPVQMVDTVLQV